MGAVGAPCADGFWLKPSDPDFEPGLAAILSAYHAGTSVAINADDEDSVGINRWTGSGGWFWRITSLEFGA